MTLREKIFEIIGNMSVYHWCDENTYEAVDEILDIYYPKNLDNKKLRRRIEKLLFPSLQGNELLQVTNELMFIFLAKNKLRKLNKKKIEKIFIVHEWEPKLMGIIHLTIDEINILIKEKGDIWED